MAPKPLTGSPRCDPTTQGSHPVDPMPLTLWSIREVQVHPAHLRTCLTGHAGAAAPNARATPNDQRQLQDDFLGAWDTDVDLQESQDYGVLGWDEDPHGKEED